MGITVDKIDDEEALPISVIVPLSDKRKDFFNNYTLPLIEANNPAEIIVNDNYGSAAKKRNQGYDLATQPYIYYCDDDILLPSNLLENMHNRLKDQSNDVAYVYCGYNGIVIHHETHPIKNNYRIETIPFNGDRLRQANYISPMSLFRKDVVVKFDEKLPCLEDWDLYLQLLELGYVGVPMVNESFYAFYLDEGITSVNSRENEMAEKIRKKYKKLY